MAGPWADVSSDQMGDAVGNSEGRGEIDGLEGSQATSQILCSSSPNSVSRMSRRYVHLCFLSSNSLGTLLSSIT